ncbi:hypothetical protein DRN73_00040 [Candidatus Pacearchaeota archaeon]|nr:MAG: hypothetical protein DRN73_00040 [Candidatus Pacearchaeota archaeon]
MQDNFNSKELKKIIKKYKNIEKKVKGHRARVKKRFFEEGPQSFTDEDLLELLLFFGIPRKDTRIIARELLKKYNQRLDKVLDANPQDLLEVKGIGLNSLLPLKVVHEVAKRYLKAKSEKADYLKSPEEIYQYLMYELKGKDKEVFMVIFLDTQFKVLGVEKLFEGTLTETAVYPREIFAKALEKKAVSLILVHNHPSGNLTPSKEDIRLTKLLILTGKLLQFKILDHLIIGETGYYSMAEKGIIEKLEKELTQL